MAQAYYTPQRVRWLLERYAVLAAAAEGHGSLADLRDDVGLQSVALFAPSAQGVDPRVDPRYYHLPSKTNRPRDLGTAALIVKCDLDRAIHKALSDQEQRIVTLFWLEGYTTREIARKLRVNQSTVVRWSWEVPEKLAFFLGFRR